MTFPVMQQYLAEGQSVVAYVYDANGDILFVAEYVDELIHWLMEHDWNQVVVYDRHEGVVESMHNPAMPVVPF